MLCIMHNWHIRVKYSMNIVNVAKQGKYIRCVTRVGQDGGRDQVDGHDSSFRVALLGISTGGLSLSQPRVGSLDLTD